MPTTDCVPALRVQHQTSRPIDVTFDAPATTSDGGWLLARAVDDRTGTIADMAAQLREWRDPTRIDHDLTTLLRQRVYQILAGYEDANDANALRQDPLLRVVCGREPDGNPLASQPTLSRLEARVTARQVVALQRAHERRWVDSLPDDLPVLVLDIDGTDDPTHGQQQFAFFNRHYGGTIYAPLLIFDQHGRLASARLRPGTHHHTQFAAPTLERLIRLVRARFAHLPIVVRGDAAFGVAAIINRLDALRRELGNVEYLLGVSPNSAIRRGAAEALARTVAWSAGRTDGCARSYESAIYQSETWTHAHRIVLKVEQTATSTDIRCVVTTLEPLAPRETYALYAGRGDAENRIKDFKHGLDGDRLSCHRYIANAFRLQLHAAAYELLHALRDHAMASAMPPSDDAPTNGDAPANDALTLHPTTLPAYLWLCRYGAVLVDRVAAATAPRPQFDTLRQRLLKVAATVRRTARRLWITLPRSFPAAALFRRLLATLGAHGAPTA